MRKNKTLWGHSLNIGRILKRNEKSDIKDTTNSLKDTTFFFS